MKKIALYLFGLAIITALVLQARNISAKKSADAMPVEAPAKTTAIRVEGRVVTYPGDEVVVGTDVAGTITRLSVAEGDRVRRGQLVATIRSTDLAAAIAEAGAKVSEAEADLRLFETEVERSQKLFDAQVGTRQQLDRAKRDRDAAAARLQTSRASEQRMRAQMQKTEIYSPIDGVVVARNADPGESVKDGQGLLTIANVRRLRVEAEVDEFDLGRLAVGAPAKITAEGFANQAWDGRIEELPYAVVGRRLKPEDPGRPSDTRVLLTKIEIPKNTPLKLGQRVEVEIAVSNETVAKK